MDKVTTIFVLLVAFQLKHYVADFKLQNEYMLKKFSPNWDFFLPLLSHTLVHAAFTFGIAGLFTNLKTAFALALLDLVIHFTMDRIKASPKMLGRYQNLTKRDFIEHSQRIASVHGNLDEHKLVSEMNEEFNARKVSNVKFWEALGLDQKVHHLTHYLIIYLIVQGI